MENEYFANIGGPNSGLYEKQYSSGHKFSILITGFGYFLICGFEDTNLEIFVHQNCDF